MLKITGNILNKEKFKFIELDYLDAEKILDVLNGKVAGCIFRNVINPDIREKIIKNFGGNNNLTQRNDGVLGSYLGTYHYLKKLDDYLEQSTFYNKELPKIFEGTENIFQKTVPAINGNNLKKNPPNSYLLVKTESPYRLVSVNREGDICYIDSYTNKIFNETPITIIQSDYIINKFDTTHSAYIGMLGGIAYEKKRQRNRLHSKKLVGTHNKKPSLRIVN